MTAAVAGGAGGALVVTCSILRSISRVGKGSKSVGGALEKRHTGTREPFRLLALAIIYRATLDARRGDVEARRWLLSDPWAAYLCDVLDLSRARLIRAVCASTAAGAVVSDD